jgi:hypothetical protein
MWHYLWWNDIHDLTSCQVNLQVWCSQNVSFSQTRTCHIRSLDRFWYHPLKISSKGRGLKRRHQFSFLMGTAQNEITLDIKKKSIGNKHDLKLLFLPRWLIKWVSTWVMILILLSMLCMLCNYCLFMRKLLLFALSPPSFMDDQHLGVNKIWKMN